MVKKKLKTDLLHCATAVAQVTNPSVMEHIARSGLIKIEPATIN